MSIRDAMRQELTQDLPIALRRPRRSGLGTSETRVRSTSISTEQQVHQETLAPTPVGTQTPSKPKPKKRVRFSDPGPEIASHDDSEDFPCSSTGLTPMVRRTSLGTSPSPKRRRRHSMPMRKLTRSSLSSAANGGDEEDELAADPAYAPSIGIQGKEIHFFSLRQILDDRVKRRIRRNGLSEEMNAIESETKQQRRGRGREAAEVQRLRDELAEKDDEIERLQNATFMQDTDRILELEQQIERLRSELQQNQDTHRPAGRNDDVDMMQLDESHCDWTLAARDPFSDSYFDGEEGFGDSTMADLVTSTPSKSRGKTSTSASGSFPTPPCTSPLAPATPCSMRRMSMPLTPQSHVGTQASLPDPGKEAMKEEMGSLRLELSKLTSTLEAHSALQERISDKLARNWTSNTEHVDDAKTGADALEAHLDSVIQTLGDRTAALLDLNTSLSSLGFPGNDASEIIASLAGAFRSARLELEYLSPGEITLPLSSHGAEVLDLVLTRLRDLARKAQEDEDTIDEYHAQELSLRQQLAARVDAMDSRGREIKNANSSLLQKDERISELEVGLDRLKGAAEGYRRDIAELETLVSRMEEEHKTSETTLQSEKEQVQTQLAERSVSIADLEKKLSDTLQQTETLKNELGSMKTQNKTGIKNLNRSHGAALALRDARVSELKREIDIINADLRRAHETIRRLRVDNSGLERRYEDEKRKAKEAVDSMREELERVSSELLAITPRKTPSSTNITKESAGAIGDDSGFVEAPRRRSTRRSGAGTKTPESRSRLSGDLPKARKRRRYDSGLGFLDEDEVDMVA